MQEKSLNCKKVYQDIILDYANFVSGSRSKEPLWPMHSETIAWYMAPYYLRDLLETFRGLRKKGFSIKEIAKLWIAPTRVLYNRIFFSQIERSDLSRKESIELMEYIISCYAELKSGDLANKHKRQLVWNQKQLKNEIRHASFLQSNLPTEKRMVGKLELGLYYLLELIYFYHHARGHEIHGPYELKKNHSILVREYFDLRVPYFAFAKKVPFVSLKILEKIEDLEIQIDTTQHLFSIESIPQHVSEIAVQKDGVFLKNWQEVVALSEAIAKTIDLALEENKGFSEKDWIKKCVESYYWTLKPLKDLLGKDWKPPKQLYADIQKGGHPAPQFAPPNSPPEEVKKRIVEKYDLWKDQ